MSSSEPNKPYCYQYPHPAVTVDAIIFALHEDELKVLLIQRGNEPYRGCWALPGGFVEIDESIDVAAQRELEEETGLEKVFLEQLHTFGEPKRDPRERVISVAYYSLVKLKDHKIRAASDAAHASWFPIRKLPPLAFDHSKIMEMAIERLRGKVIHVPIIFDILPAEFTLAELQHVYERIIDWPMDTFAFGKRILDADILVPVKTRAKRGQKKAEPCYKFDKRRYHKMQGNGFYFEMKPDMSGRKLKS